MDNQAELDLYSIPAYAKLVGVNYADLRGIYQDSEVKPEHSDLERIGVLGCKLYTKRALDEFFGKYGVME